MTGWHVERFLLAQDLADEEGQMTVFNRAKIELQRGYKQSHWMWVVFPQAEGRSRSLMGRYFSLRSGEVAAYKAHPVLWPRLVDVTAIVRGHVTRPDGPTVEEIFGDDAGKLRSCMELFGLEVEPTAEPSSERLSDVDLKVVGMLVLGPVTCSVIASRLGLPVGFVRNAVARLSDKRVVTTTARGNIMADENVVMLLHQSCWLTR